ncbi:MAG: hypothetical protein M3513_04820, partial [Actinomycetota bacterium]|nr:hypothetical protein [Actinomycetota bacterium]
MTEARPTLKTRMFRRTPLEDVGAARGHGDLKRSIGLFQLTMFGVVGITGWNTDNLSNFAPFGAAGVWAATGAIFFSFIGLDAVST